MKLQFLGTKGYIDISSKKHKMHSSILFSYKNCRVMIDCGESFLKKIKDISPDFIVITHAHPDHAWGLKNGAPCPVFATEEAWNNMDFPIRKKKIMPLRKKIKIGPFIFEAFPVIHSIRCQAVGYKIQAGKKKIFFVPDVVYIENIKEAFKDILFYIGDGATIYRNMVRRSKKTKELFGHATIKSQLTWCRKNKVSKMIITHCGKDVVKNEKKAKEIIEKMARDRGVEVKIAYDKMVLII
jgi:ribonuclease BN (tRNA processing enzyme)